MIFIKQIRIASFSGAVYCLFLYSIAVHAQKDNPVLSELPAKSEFSTGLSKNVIPVIGAWFWGEEEFEPNGYRDYINYAHLHSPYNLLTTSFRVSGKEVTGTDVHDQVKLAVEYARERGIQMAVDLDVRLARQAFEAAYPEELQQLLRLQELVLSANDTVEAVVRSVRLTDHMTGRTMPYISLRASLLRVYSYDKATGGIQPNTLEDITRECVVAFSSKDSVVVRIPRVKKNSQTQACVMVSFTHLTPDVFAPHLMSFQNDIIRGYGDVPMAGVMKDEWGFPPSVLPIEKQFWYSKYRAQAYKERTGGRDFLSDCLLMYLGVAGREGERQMAINHLMEMNWQRNGALEDDFYHTVKEVFGPQAFVGTHATWYAYLCKREYKKNGLDWWVATRDWAQTDEYAPFAARTSLAKKWNSPVWYNQYYDSDKNSYQRELWSSVLAGGRINYHPIYPDKTGSDGHVELLRGNLMQGESKVRLLNYIAQSPLDCPVAVIFGHPGIMNWAGSAYDDEAVMELVNELWCQGIPADIIPSSEIEQGSLVFDSEGRVAYGPQSYSAVVLYNPEFERESVADFFKRASLGKTSLFRIGDWTRNFNGEVYHGDEALPGSMKIAFSNAEIISELKEILKNQKQFPQTPARKLLNRDIPPVITHPTTGVCRLIDGTVIQVAGTDNVEGDSIFSTIEIHGTHVFFDAIGVAAIRLDDDGQVQAMVAGGLKSFKSGTFEINLGKRVDFALWLDDTGNWEGVIQGCKGNIPSQLLAITKNWESLRVPIPLSE